MLKLDERSVRSNTQLLIAMTDKPVCSPTVEWWQETVPHNVGIDEVKECKTM